MPAYRTRDTYSRNLEVTTDAPLPPTVSIISPTPRAFTFPAANLVPFSSPSHSPFEPDLKSLIQTPPPVRTFSPTSSIGSETSSVQSSPSALSSQASHRRRRSVASDIERRPKKGDEDYIKRPENAFILFRRKCCEERQAAMDEAGLSEESSPVKKQRQADLSKQISQQWKTLSSEDRAHWEVLAKEKKKEHEQMYPNYVYRPQRTKERAKAKKGKGKRFDGEGETDDSISFILPVPSPPRSLSRGPIQVHTHGHGRRAASAPTPPPAYQTIQLPSVYMPSCPTSPSLIPRISRRTPMPQHPIPPPTDSDPSTHFEYLPDDTLLPPFQRPFDTNVSLHNSFQIYHQFDGQQPIQDRGQTVPLHSLNIPREPMMYMSSSMISPADSASSLMSPADSIASTFSPSSPQGAPYTPADALALSSLSIVNQSNETQAQCLQQQQDAMESQEMQTHEMGYGGYSWQSQSMWADPNEAILPDDFDLRSIPPIELGLSATDAAAQAACDMENSHPYGLMEEHDFHDTIPGGNDPFASLFAYDTMNW